MYICLPLPYATGDAVPDNSRRRRCRTFLLQHAPQGVFLSSKAPGAPPTNRRAPQKRCDLEAAAAREEAR